MVVVMAGTIMVVLDSTIVNVALHQIGVALHSSTGVEWVVTAYLLAVCTAQPVTGWLANRCGRKVVFLGALAAFTMASVLCACAPNLGALIACRALQGLGGGALVPIGMAIILDLFPAVQHGRALATWGMAAMIAPAIGPTVGGWMVTAIGWRWLFLINAPIGVATIASGLRLLPQRGHRSSDPFDLLGLLIGTGGLTLLVLGVAQGNGWGWTSPATVACIGIGVLALAAFVPYELRTEHPLIELRMFQERSFRTAMLIALFLQSGYIGRLVFVPLELESLRGESALRVGILFLPPAIASATGMWLGGRLVDRVGPRFPVVIGCTITAVSVASCGRLTLTTPLFVIGVLLFAQGFGTGTVMAPVMVAGLSTLPARLLSHGTSLRSLTNQIGSAVAVAALGAIISVRMGGVTSGPHAQAAYNAAFIVMGASMVVCVFLGTRLPGRAVLRLAAADAEGEVPASVETLAFIPE
jgi:EmrB/QacA subfamily drug resistance transporter